MKKRIISMVLALVMVLGMIPWSAMPAEAAEIDLIWPCQSSSAYRISCIYYYKQNYKNSHCDEEEGNECPHHSCRYGYTKGIDITGGGNIVAAAAGEVAEVDYQSGGFGNYIVIKHSNGKKTLYAHLKSTSVEVGDSVKQGQVIGVMGSTGNSTGTHLHFEYSGSDPFRTFFKDKYYASISFEPNCYSNNEKYNTDSFICDWLNSYYEKKNGVYVWNGVAPIEHEIDTSYPTPFKAYCLKLGTSDDGLTPLYSSVNGAKSGKYIYNGYKGDDDLCTIEEVYTNGWCKVKVPGISDYQYCKLSVFISGSPTITSTTTTQKMTTYRRKDGATSYGSIGSGKTVTVLGSSGSYTQVIYVGAQSINKCMWVRTSDLKPDYTVKYNANGGSGAPSDQIKKHDVTLTLSSTKPTRTGYSFQGWATSSSATSATYKAGGKYSSNAAVTLYAVWKANTYSVKFNANGGSGTMAAQSHTYGSSKALTANAFTRTGYTFSGWATSSTGSVKYTDKQSVSNLTSTSGGTVNLYAVWKANTYTVKFNANGGSGTMSDQSHTYGSAKTLTTNAFSRTGYTFVGWATSATGSVVYTDGQSVKDLTSTANGTVNLYAVWQRGCPDGHNYSYSVTTTPTTVSPGALTGICADCFGTTTVVLPKLSTTYYTYEVIVATTCKDNGIGRYTWNDTVYGTYCFDVTITKTEHSYTCVVTDPTCTEGGYTTSTCTVCGHSYVDSHTPAAGHSYGTWYTVTEATCTTNGQRRCGCTNCDHYETAAVEALGHDLTQHEVKEPTCTEIGWDAYETCSRCEYSTCVQLPATGHNYESVITAPTCTEQGYTTCTCACGDSYVGDYVEAKGHSYESGICTGCGKIQLTYVLGDVNEDGEIDILDANMVVGFFNGTVELSENQLAAADVNGDGEIDILDANRIVGYFNGTVDSFLTEE